MRTMRKLRGPRDESGARRSVRAPLPIEDVGLIGRVVEDAAHAVQAESLAIVVAQRPFARRMLDWLAHHYDLPLVEGLREGEVLESIVHVLSGVRTSDAVDGVKVRTRRSNRRSRGPESRTLGSAVVEVLVRGGALPHLAGESRASEARRRFVYDVDRKLRRLASVSPRKTSST